MYRVHLNPHKLNYLSIKLYLYKIVANSDTSVGVLSFYIYIAKKYASVIYSSIDFMYSIHTLDLLYFIQHCFICNMSSFIVTEDGGFEPRTVPPLEMRHIRLLFMDTHLFCQLSFYYLVIKVILEKPAELQISIWLASHLARAPNS